MSQSKSGNIAAGIELDEFRFDWGSLPAITAALPGTGGHTRELPEDFIVSEVPRQQPSGEGEYCFAYVEKRGLNTHDLIAALQQGGVRYDEVGVAGLKDRFAVTRQWISLPVAHTACLAALEDLEHVKILETTRHTHRLRRGHLQGNRFEVHVRHPHADWPERASAIQDRIGTLGLPNYFAQQRFGRFNSNAIDAVRILRGEKVPGGRRLNDFFISALQAHVFNWILKRRIEMDVYDMVLPGDRARRHDTGGMFLVGDAAEESQRAQRLEISAVLPLYGRKVAGGLQDAAVLETDVLARFGLKRSDFRPITRGAWRISRALPTDVHFRPSDAGYVAEFTLPSGAYATNFLRELTKTPAQDHRMVGG